MDYGYRQLSEIVQLDGPADNSDPEEEEVEVPLEENDFLGLISAEAMKTLQEENGSSDGVSFSSSSDDDGPDDLANVQEEVRIQWREFLARLCSVGHRKLFAFFDLVSDKLLDSFDNVFLLVAASLTHKVLWCDL